MSASAQRCVFCQSPGPLTDEHVWGDWILKGGYVPRSKNKHTHATTVIERPGVSQLDVRTRAGDPLGANIKIVCPACNSGWMSGIQDAAKAHLIPLFKGNCWAFGVTPQRAIAAWACMATMTSEYLSRNDSLVAVSQQDRDLLRTGLGPLPAWRVWLGHYERENWIGQWVHTTVPILEGRDVPAGTPAPPNTQSTTFVIGKLLVHTMSSHFPEHTSQWDWRPVPWVRDRLVQIWPIQRPLIIWPPRALGDKDVRNVSMAFFNAVDEIGRSLGY